MRGFIAAGASMLLAGATLVSVGVGSASAATKSSPLTNVKPVVVLDTQRHIGAAGGLTSGSTTVLKVAGANGVPSTGVQSVLLDISAFTRSGGTAPVYLTPDGAPEAGSPSFTIASRHPQPDRRGKQPTTNHVTERLVAAVGTNGSVDVRVGGTAPVDITASVIGYYTTRSGASSITGKVIDSYGKPLHNVRVHVSTAGVFPQNGTDVYTRTDGTYAVPSLPDGAYQVCFDPYGSTGGVSRSGYVARCYNNQPWAIGGPSGDPVSVHIGSTVIVNQTLPTGAAVAGVVTDSSGRPLGNVQTYAFLDHPGFLVGHIITTASDGSFKLKNLDPTLDGVEVCFGGAAATGGVSTTGYQETCTPELTLTPGGTTKTGTTVLQTGGAISGTVTDSLGHPLAGATVTVGWNMLGPEVATTASNGTYVAKGLSVYDRQVCFDAMDATGGGSDAQGYVAQCWQNRTDFWNADPVSVQAGSTTMGIDAHLALGAAIAGHVTDASGASLAMVWAYGNVFDGQGNGLGATASTDANGNYLIRGLPAGSASVCFDGSGASGGTAPLYGYVYQCYDNASPALATTFTVTGGQTTTDINATLSVAGAISGTVTNSAGQPLSFVFVTAKDANNQGVDFTATDPDGSYLMVGVPAGTYSVCFDGTSATDPQGASGYSSTCTTSSVTVSAGVLTTGVNQTLGVAGSISGRVTAEDGTALGQVDVTVHTTDGTYYNNTVTGDDGTYRLPPLPDGQYVVCFDASGETGGASAGGYVDECYDNTSPQSQDTATLVSVSQGTVTSGIDAALAPGAEITGRVSDSTGGPVSTSVIVSSASNFAGAYSGSDGNGGYVVRGLAAGTYTVCAYNFDTGAQACYGGSSDPSTSTPVTVNGGDVVASVDLQFS